jgi:hypothetical protein
MLWITLELSRAAKRRVGLDELLGLWGSEQGFDGLHDRAVGD